MIAGNRNKINDEERKVMEMDSIDIQILKLLKENARQKASYISKQVNLSVSSVIERIRKMEEKGIIKDYMAVVDHKKLGLDVTALMEVSLEHPKFYDSFTEAVKKSPYIVECYYLTGDYDFCIKICCESSDKLESIHRMLKSINGVSHTTTHFVLKEVKNIFLPDVTEKNVLKTE